MAYSAFVDAVKLVDRLEKRSSSSIIMKGQTQILKQELRFLSTFLKYTAKRCTEYEGLQDFVTQIEDVSQTVEKKLLRFDPRKKPSSVEFGDAVGDVLDKIKLVKPNIREAQMRVSMLSRSGSQNVVKYIDSLQEDLKELIECKADLLQPSLKEGIKVLARKLRFLTRLVRFTEKRCKENDKLNKLFSHVQAMADNAAYLAYSCLSNEMDQGIARRLALELSDLIQKIEPVKPEVREIYIGVVKASKSKNYKIDQTVVKFVDSLLENTTELLCIHGNIMPLKDQIEILHVELRSLRHFLQDGATSSSSDLLADVEIIAIDAGVVIYALFEREVKQEEIANEMKLALSRLLEKFKLFMALVRKKYIRVGKRQIHNFPITNELGALDLLLRNLKELLKNDRVVSFITPLKHPIQIVQRDLEFLGSFLTTISKQHHEHEKLEDLWRRIIHVVYEVEYVIDLVVVAVDDHRVLHHMLWLSDLIEEIKFIKTEVSEIRINSDKKYGIQLEDDVQLTKKSSSRETLSQTNAPRSIDAEMVGFKDEEAKLLDQLLCGSMQLQIVALVGMPGLGKTFLAQTVYNKPIIKHHFYVQAWCNVSQVYGRKELLINILNQVKNSAQDKMCQKTDEELAGELHKCLKGQKYLIVLDDIWDIGAWDALRRSFPNDNTESRIVFTSRFSPLALQARPDSKLHHLRSFSDSESWELLQKKIFQTESSCPLELLEVGQQIATSCNGLPLAVVVVAGLLARTGKEQDRWREVAKSLSSYIISDPQRKCMDILDLSYKNLPDYLKPCFLYFGAFLEDEEILVAKLTKLWIAEGFVLEDNESNLEYIAEGYLMDLIDKSLIIASKKRSTGGVKACLIHDLVRDFCLAKAKEENFLKVIEAAGGDFSTRYDQQRRLFVHCRQRKQICFKSSGPCVRSLLFFAPRRIRLPPEEVSSIIEKFQLLRVLDLMCNELSCFPQRIERLAQLKYLAVSGNFHSFPSSITKLGNLETFIVRAIVGVISPDTILEMTKLRHLHVKYFRFPDHVSPYYSQLDSLQTMSRPFLSYGDDMKIMRSFPNLKKLSCVLRESWDSSSNCNRLPELDILNKLESLKVSYSGEMRHPCEFSLPSNIKKLTMSKLRLPWKKISIVGKLPNLEVLKLDFDAFEGQEWNMQDGDFPKLKFLKLKHLNIRKWIASTTDCFPPLERLILVGCHQLEEIPSCLEDVFTLNMILVEDCSNSLETAIKRIEEEQRDLGNELKIEIKRYED